ncbi:MAG TPA: DNA polymerase III subunit gamma/tau [Candidatus Aquicultor sp.]|jgi:DNA polymerase-3 subunit gamma/tau
MSLYRKWRPQTFDEIAGQPHITQTLKNAIEKGRIAHAYLFCGPRGTGKTTTARVLAKAINCEQGPTTTPCNKCTSCVSINDGTSMDVLELDAASNSKVDEIREFLERIPYSATEGNKKVYIIDEVHMLSPASFNALLKTLEEPPEHVVFVLATTETHKVLPTILSRCQRFDFRRISVADIEERLKTVAEAEQIAISDDAITLIANHAQGALRDALGVLDQLASYSKEKISLADVTALLGVTDSQLLISCTDMLVNSDLAGGLVLIEQLVAGGTDLRQFVLDLVRHLRDLFLTKTVPGRRIGAIPDELYERFKAQTAAVDPRSLMFFINTLNEVYNQSRWAADIRLSLEIALFKMVRSSDDVSTESMLHRIERLEATLASGENPASATSSTASAFVQLSPEAAGPQAVKGNAPATDSAPASVRTKKTECTPTAKQTGGAAAHAGEAPAIETLDIGEMKRAWPQVLKIIKEKKKTRYNFFAAAKLMRIEQGRLVLALKESDKTFVESPENMRLLRDAVKVASGIDVPIICELANGGTKTVAVVETDAPEGHTLAVDEYVKLVQNTFGAKIVEDISIDNMEKSQEDK